MPGDAEHRDSCTTVRPPCVTRAARPPRRTRRRAARRRSRRWRSARASCCANRPRQLREMAPGTCAARRDPGVRFDGGLRLVVAGEALDATVANMRFVKPLDAALLNELAQRHELIVTVEEGAIMGGAGSACAEALAGCGDRPADLASRPAGPIYRSRRPGAAAVRVRSRRRGDRGVDPGSGSRCDRRSRGAGGDMCASHASSSTTADRSRRMGGAVGPIES